MKRKRFRKRKCSKKNQVRRKSKNLESIYSGNNHCRNEQSSFPSQEWFPVRVPVFVSCSLSTKKTPARFHPGVLLVRTNLLIFANKNKTIMSKSRKTKSRKQTPKGKELRTLEDILNCNDAEQLARACMEARNRIPKETRDIIERMLKSEGFIF